MLIEVIGLRHVDRGRLRAYADILVGDLIVRDFVILDGPGHEPFVGVPRKSWTEDGQRFFTPIIEFRNGLRDQVRKAILLKWSAEGTHGKQPRHPAGGIGTPA